MRPRSRQFQTFSSQIAQINHGLVDVAAAVARTARAQRLFYGMEQAVAVVEHDLVELFALRLVHLPRLQCLQVEPDRSDRSFQLVSDGVKKAVLLFVATDFAHQENRVQDQSRNDQHEKDYAENEHRHLAPVINHPDGIARDRQRDQTSAERDKKVNRFAIALNAHYRNSADILADRKITGRKLKKGSGEWGVGSGDWKTTSLFPIRYSPLPTPHSPFQMRETTAR